MQDPIQHPPTQAHTIDGANQMPSSDVPRTKVKRHERDGTVCTVCKGASSHWQPPESKEGNGISVATRVDTKPKPEGDLEPVVSSAQHTATPMLIIDRQAARPVLVRAGQSDCSQPRAPAPSLRSRQPGRLEDANRQQHRNHSSAGGFEVKYRQIARGLTAHTLTWDPPPPSSLPPTSSWRKI